MAISVLSKTFAIPPTAITSTEKLVMLALANRCDEQGRNAFPSVATLMTETCLTERCVQRTLRRLQEKGFIVGHARAYKPTIYTLAIPDCDGGLEPGGLHPGGLCPPSGGHEPGGTPGRGAPEPSLSEPSLNRQKDFRRTRQSRKGHKDHAYCGGRVCISNAIADQLARALGGPYEQARDRIRQMAVAVDDEVSVPPQRDAAIESNQFKFWNDCYERFFRRLGASEAA